VTMPCPGCGEPRGGRYPHGELNLCWPCYVQASGIDPSPRQPTTTRASHSRIVAEAVERFTRAFGPPIATPECVNDGRGGLERARFRQWRWPCPVCGGGSDDPIYRPLVITSDGEVRCEACDCDAPALRTELEIALGVRALLEELA
jgi:hypothetical protein